MEFLDRVLETCKAYPESIALRQPDGRTMTYAELLNVSGGVCEGILRLKLKRDSFVLINLPRGIDVIAAMLGIWRAGAALVVCEKEMPAARTEQIRQDIGCVYTLDETAYAEMRALPPFEGRVSDIGEHDAAFAVYTSGSTGSPKGVIHEFGKLDLIFEVDRHADYDHNNQTVGNVAPLNTILNMLLMVPALANRCILDIVSYPVIKDPGRLLSYIATSGITMMFMPPSLIKMLPVIPKPLQVIFAGSERSENVYREGVRILNGYALSESGFTALYHTVRPNEPINPVGVSLAGRRAYLAEDDGTEVTGEGTGELVIENPYTRGYVHPELNAGVFENGYLHTGDIASWDKEDGFTVRGRMDDMIKIRGNRVEPNEIESAVKQALGISWAAARGFSDGAAQYICVYYKDKVTFDTEELKNELAKRLPEYMIPTYYRYLETVPMLPNGKIDKKSFPQPEREDALSAYAPPADALEERICGIFSELLGVKKVGANDDFYRIGGDSMTAMQLLSDLDADVPLEQLLEARTPRRIAEKVRTAQKLPDREELRRRADEAKKRPHPLTPMQRYILRYSMYTPNSTMWNLPSFMRFDTGRISAERMCALMKQLIAAHPALQTSITLNSKGYLEQCWTPELLDDITVERLTENELSEKREDLVRPFSFGDVPLTRCRVFETERAGYVFLDVHHSVTDGYSLRNMRRDFIKLINGEEIDDDYYFLNVEDDIAQEGSELYLEAQKYFRENYSGDRWARYPIEDHESRSNTAGTMEITVPIRRHELEDMKRYYGVTSNELCMAAFMLSIAKYNRVNDVHCVWTYHGRNDAMRQHSVGLMFRMMPVALHFRNGMLFTEVFASLREQFRRATMYNCYPFALEMFDPSSQDRASCFFQADIYEYNELEKLGIESLDINDRYGASCGILDMSCVENDEGMVLHVDYDASRYEKSSMRRFCTLVARHITGLQQRKWDTVDLERYVR